MSSPLPMPGLHGAMRPGAAQPVVGSAPILAVRLAAIGRLKSTGCSHAFPSARPAAYAPKGAIRLPLLDHLVGAGKEGRRHR